MPDSVCAREANAVRLLMMFSLVLLVVHVCWLQSGQRCEDAYRSEQLNSTVVVCSSVSSTKSSWTVVNRSENLRSCLDLVGSTVPDVFVVADTVVAGSAVVWVYCNSAVQRVIDLHVDVNVDRTVSSTKRALAKSYRTGYVESDWRRDCVVHAVTSIVRVLHECHRVEWL